MYSNFKYFFLISSLFIHYTQCNTVHREYYSETSDISHTTQRNRYESMLCMNIQPQHSLNIDYITGEWYGNEIIMHTQDVPGVYDYNSCVEVRLSDISDQMQSYESNYRDGNIQHRQYQQQQQTHQQTQHNLYNNNNNNNNNHNNRNDHIGNNNNNNNNNHDGVEHQYGKPKFLRLVWHENDDNLEYTFNYTSNNPGLWTNIGEQRGSLVALNKYTQFMGTVQVVKAVNDQLVLTFCGSGIRSSIYTIILSRKVNGLAPEEVSSIRNLLARRGLSTESIRKVCGHAAGSKSAVVIVNTLLLLLATMIVVRQYF